jgi:hypothetical protein
LIKIAGGIVKPAGGVAEIGLLSDIKSLFGSTAIWLRVFYGFREDPPTALTAAYTGTEICPERDRGVTIPTK